MLALLGLGACAAPPEGASPASPASPPLFSSSQIKPASPARGALAPLPRLAARLAAQRAYFKEHPTGSAADKAAALRVSTSVVTAGLRDLRASALPNLRLELRGGQRVEVETRNLSQGADPVLHLWSRKDRREVAFDDDSGVEPGAARLSFTAPRAGSYIALVRAYDSPDDGFCDLVVDGVTRLGGAKLGGSVVPVAAGSLLEAVLLNDGQGSEPWPPSGRAALDTLLLLVDGASGRLLDLDDDSGVELGSRLGASRAALAVVGALSADDEGTARLVVNDADAADSDGDGLGDGLEQALCLCPRADAVVCGFDCRGVTSAQDSDGDGLSDAVELLGLDHEQMPQLLPRWGADPRHKDLFVEIDLADWTDETTTPPERHLGRSLEADDARAAARVFGRLTGMKNPDGGDGVRLHLDVGHPCGALPSGVDEVCGDLCALGRDGVRRCGQSRFPGPPTPRLDGLAPGRRHLFHVAISDCLVAGQAPGGPADNLEFDCDRFSAMVHELGHNLGLSRHYGTPQTGGGNCKPSYPSLMNYAFSDRFDGTREVRFSDGSFVGDGDLDPRGLDETKPYGGSDAEVGWLASRPFYFQLHDCVAPGRGCKVDWNRDGQLDPSVRAFLSPMPGYGAICENDHGNARDTENIEDLEASSGPAAAELLRIVGGAAKPALYVVAPRHSAGSTDRATLEVNHTFGVSGGWQGWQPVPGPPLRGDAQPAAITVKTGGAEELWIFACAPGSDPIQLATIDDRGTITPPSALPGQPAGLRCRDVSVAEHGGDLLLMVRDDAPLGGDRVYLTRHTPAGWTGFVVPSAEGAPLRSTVTPALAVGPNGRLYVLIGDPAPPPGGGPYGRMHLFGSSGAAETLEDEELWGLRFEDGTPDLEHVTWSRPAMAFVPHLDGQGQLLPGGRGYLAIWWSRGIRVRHLWTWGQLDAQGAHFTLGRWHHYEAMGFVSAISGSSPALALRGGKQLTALVSQARLYPRLVRHIPFADGIPDTDLVLRDFDDRVPIRQSLCTSLNWDCKERCKRLSDPCSTSKTSQPLTDVSCALPSWGP